MSPSARFCSSCGAPRPSGDPADPPEATLKVVTVVFSDLVGSTALQEALDNEAVRQVMARFYETIRTVAARHGGQIQKFIGDAVVIIFGVPVLEEDDALRAVRCAAAMVAELGPLNDELERRHGIRLAMRTGVNTGELVVSREGIFVGDTMNTAARLEQAAPPGEVLIGETTRRLVRDAVELEAVAALELKGKSRPVAAWRLVSPVGVGRAAAAEAPLVGREAELRRLQAAFDQVTGDRACHLVTLIGSPGLGKSRLSREFAASLEGRARVLNGHCEPTGEGITFLPVADVLRGAAAINEADGAELVLEKLRAVVGGDLEAARVVRCAAGVLGAGQAVSPEETFWGFRRIVESLARRELPLVVVLEDIHWGQPMFLDLIEHLVEWVRDAPVLLVALARPELRELRAALTSPGRRASEVIDLEPLAPDHSRELVDGLLGAVELSDDLLARILATTEGNPLFLSELLRMLVDEGALVRSGPGERWTASGGADAVQVPPTIQALLTARIERLRSEERAVVERAAVIGQQFYRGAVAELAPPPVSAGLDGHLEMLRRKEMVEPDGTYWIDEPVYRFHHVLIRDAAYHLLLKEARAELHERFADWLEAKAGELVGEHEEVIAYHLEQAHAYRRQLGPLDERGRALGRRAAARLGSAGRRALAREDLAAAANLLRRAVDRHPGQSEPGLLWDLGEALLSAGETASAAEVVAQLEPVARARAAVLAGHLSALTGDATLPAVLDTVARALDELSAAGDGGAVAKGHHVLAQIQAQLGRVADVETSLDRALLAAREVGDRRRITAVLAAAPRAALWGPSPVVRASGRCLDVVRILRMTPGNRHVEAVALRCQAVLEAMRGRPQAAREILSSGRATLQELGLTLELHELETHAGIVELLAGEPEAARGLLSEARRGFDALGLSVAAAQAAALLARALVELARDDEALAACEFAERHGGGELKTTIAWMGVRAEALARREEAIEEALALAQRAVSLAEPTDALADKADAHMALARVALAAGHRAAARQAAANALALYEAKDHAVGVRLATELTGASGPAADRPPARAAALGRRPSERVAADVLRLFHARDHDALARIVAPDAYAVDHRALGWEEAHGRDPVLAIMRSWLDASPDLRVDYDEVLACDDRLLAVRMAWRGQGVKAGELELQVGAVHLIEDGLWRGIDFYEADDRTAMLSRYAELGGGQGPLGDRPPDELTRRFVRAYAARDLDRLSALVSEDFVMVDRRGIAWDETTGRDAWLPVIQSGFQGVTDSRVEIDEMIAGDDRVIAVVLAWRGTASPRAGSGRFEFPVGHVTVVEDGRMTRVEQFDPGDRDGMLRRFGELGGREAVLGDRPPERVVRETQRLLHERRYDLMRAIVAEDWRSVDHRAVGWESYHGRDEWEAITRSFFDASPSARIEYQEVLACDERVIALRLAWRSDGVKAGPVEVLAGGVYVIEGGRWVSADYYEPDDRQAMIARYAELGGGLGPLGDSPPERWPQSGRGATRPRTSTGWQP